MHIIRLFFTKQGEAAYISHLDLQRVMARALRRSGLPVWYSQGFNPHIYMSFALPLPLMQQSLAETVDVKTESDDEDFSGYLDGLNRALPKGLHVSRIGRPRYAAGDIASAEYDIFYPILPDLLQQAVEKYNAAPDAMVLRKTKRSEQQVNLKEYIPVLSTARQREPFSKEPGFYAAIEVRLPAGGQLNVNPELLTGLLQQIGLPAEGCQIVRTRVLTKEGIDFA